MKRMGFKQEKGSATTKGAAKQTNEDSFLLESNERDEMLLAVADGVSSLEDGDTASSFSVGALKAWWNTEYASCCHDISLAATSLSQCVAQINEALVSSASSRQTKMGTTLSVLLLQNSNYIFLHIGDSRIYRIKKGFLRNIDQLTRDHTKTMPKLVGGVTRNKKYLTQCLGYKKEICPDCDTGEVNKGDLFFVCSDGVYKTISEKDMLRLAAKGRYQAERICRLLLDAAIQRGEGDDITVVAATSSV